MVDASTISQIEQIHLSFRLLTGFFKLKAPVLPFLKDIKAKREVSLPGFDIKIQQY